MDFRATAFLIGSIIAGISSVVILTLLCICLKANYLLFGLIPVLVIVFFVLCLLKTHSMLPKLRCRLRRHLVTESGEKYSKSYFENFDIDTNHTEEEKSRLLRSYLLNEFYGSDYRTDHNDCFQKGVVVAVFRSYCYKKYNDEMSD